MPELSWASMPASGQAGSLGRTWTVSLLSSPKGEAENTAGLLHGPEELGP